MFTLALIVTGVLIGLKLAALLVWPWLWVFSPLGFWVGLEIFLTLFVNTAAVGVVSTGHIFAWRKRRAKLKAFYESAPAPAPTTTNENPWWDGAGNE